MKLYVEEAIIAFDHLKKLKSTITIVILDILFLLLYGFIQGAPEISGFIGKTYQYLKVFLNLVSESAKSLTEDAARKVSVLQLIGQNDAIARYFYLIILTLILFAIATYILYVIIEGSAWWHSYKAINKQISYKKFITQFSLVSLPFYTGVILLFILSFADTYRAITLERMSLPSPIGLKLFMLFIGLVLIYFGSIAYALIGQESATKTIKKAIHIGFSKAHKYFPAFLVVFIVFFLLNFIALFLGNISPIAMMIVGILLIFPSIAWGRMYSKLVLDKIINH